MYKNKESDASHEKTERLHARVKGLVQGVGFRAFVLRTAIELDLKGWVRNRWDGSVEVIAEGERVTLESLLTELWKGPRSAHVSKIDIEWQISGEEFSSFFVRSTC